MKTRNTFNRYEFNENVNKPHYPSLKNSALRKSLASISIMASLCLCMGTAEASTVSLTNNNFTMLDANGGPVGGTNDVFASWDGTLNTEADLAGGTTTVNMTLSSPTPFFGGLWTAHDVRVFGPGTYTFEACLADGSVCSGSAPITMTIDPGQIGAHMLFDWSSTVNIDVVNVWNVDAVWGGAPNDGSTTNWLSYLGACDPVANPGSCAGLFSTVWALTSTDDDGDGVYGVGMVDGPFVGFNGNFNLRPVPVPAAVWLFGSGLLGLIGVARRKRTHDKLLNDIGGKYHEIA